LATLVIERVAARGQLAHALLDMKADLIIEIALAIAIAAEVEPKDAAKHAEG
jgi:hypothetical protein